MVHSQKSADIPRIARKTVWFIFPLCVGLSFHHYFNNCGSGTFMDTLCFIETWFWWQNMLVSKWSRYQIWKHSAYTHQLLCNIFRYKRCKSSVLKDVTSSQGDTELLSPRALQAHSASSWKNSIFCRSLPIEQVHDERCISGRSRDAVGFVTQVMPHPYQTWLSWGRWTEEVLCMWTSRNQIIVNRKGVHSSLFTMEKKVYTGNESHKINV